MKLRFPFPIFVLLVAASSPAPINDRSAAEPYRPERSQSRIAQEQRFNGAQPVVGGVNVNESRPLDLRDSTSPAAADAVSAGTSAVSAARAVTSASETVAGGEKRRDFPWLLLVGGALAAFGLFRGMRAWADRSLPVPDHIR